MPLLDHFRPPLSSRLRWESLHSGWATRIADTLNRDFLPAEFLAEECTHLGTSLQIDVAVREQPEAPGPDRSGNGLQTATLPRTWAPPAPDHTVPAVFSDTFEVRVFSTSEGITLVGAIELVSPGNKDRPRERQAFAAKCAGYLHQGVSVVIIDVVTNRRANLHNDILRLIEAPPEANLPEDRYLYAAAYRPVQRGERSEIDVWKTAFALGDPLPTLPLRLLGDLFVPVEFEAAYQETCRLRRLI
jgi:hypothetical protein